MTAQAVTEVPRSRALRLLDEGRERFLALSWPERLLTIFLSIMVVGGVILRIQDVAWPPFFTFDEEPFVRNAHNYMRGLPDTNDHPPFGKLLIGVGLLSFGFNSLGWRFIPLVFGLQTIVLGYFFGRSLFDSRRAGFIAAAFIAADGFFIAYSRSGLLDGMMVSFMLWGMVAAVSATNYRHVILAAVLIGLSTSVKWSGAMTAIPAAVALLALRRVSIFSILWLGLVPVVHIALWMGARELTGEPSGVMETWNVIVGLYKHHLDLGRYHNELSSPWYGWPILLHPVVVKLSGHGLGNCYASSVGNLVFWTTTTLLSVALPLVALFLFLRGRFRKVTLPFLDAKTTRGVLLMLIGWFSYIAPWIAASTTRKGYTFSHYYLPCYAFLLVMLAGMLTHFMKRYPRSVSAYVGLGLAVSLFYAPVWGEFVMSDFSAHLRLPFHNWQP
jgi:dolichyl-phosphate-mannose--protein O-mannosyl transferase